MTTQAPPKRLAVIGATGSIGRNTLGLAADYPDRFKVEIVTAGSRVDDLASAAIGHKAKLAVIADRSLEPRLRNLLQGTGIEAASGHAAIEQACKADYVDMAVVASVGFSGLGPTVAAIEADKQLALANKESLVVAGSYVMDLAARHGIKIQPIDSEHSAVAQCLAGEDPNMVERLIITASGGPFRTWPVEMIAKATAKDALKHPNWDMGAKITIDSATMINKSFELIEARWLFGITPEKISPVVHPQSVIHSMVEFKDGSVKAQLGVPDMRLPISYALGMGTRLPGAERPLDITKCGQLTFEEPDWRRFPCLGLAEVAFNRGGNAACVINAANEIAVDAFIKGRIGFTEIYRLIVMALDKVAFAASPTLDDYRLTDDIARRVTSENIDNLRQPSVNQYSQK